MVFMLTKHILFCIIHTQFNQNCYSEELKNTSRQAGV
nr:MAG TPA: hypothetical protein [Bacteriophage sp.]